MSKKFPDFTLKLVVEIVIPQIIILKHYFIIWHNYNNVNITWINYSL